MWQQRKNIRNAFALDVFPVVYKILSSPKKTPGKGAAV